MIATIKEMYTNINIKLSIEDAELIFNSISGVKQGDNLAPVLFLLFVQAAVETMHKKWSTKQIKKPDLKYFPSESDGFLNKHSSKKGAPLHHDAALYADDSAFTFLSKADLIAGTILVQKPLPNLAWKCILDAPTLPNQPPK